MREKHEKLTEEQIKRLRWAFSYDPISGDLRWSRERMLQIYWFVDPDQTIDLTPLAGKKSGERLIKINGKYFDAQRIAWVVYYGEDPEPESFVTVINRDQWDLRLENLQITADDGDARKMVRESRLHDIKEKKVIATRGIVSDIQPVSSKTIGEIRESFRVDDQNRIIWIKRPARIPPDRFEASEGVAGSVLKNVRFISFKSVKYREDQIRAILSGEHDA